MASGDGVERHERIVRTARPFVLLAIAFASTVAHADDAQPPVQEITPDEPPAKPAPPPTPPRHVYTMEEITVPKSFLRFGINFFGDARAFVATRNDPATGFAIGTLGIRMLGELGPSLDALAEVAFETTDEEGALADVEQLLIRWRHGPGTLEVGRLHTDIGYWNTAYHHGLWLQTPIERPHAVRFEDDGGLLPAHWVGAHYALGAGPVRVVIGVGNGRGRIVDDIRVSSDTNEAKAVLAKVRYKTSLVEVGAGAIYDVIAPETVATRPALPGERIQELVGSAYIVLRGNGPLLIAEGYALHHVASSRTTTTYAGYGLLGFRVTEWLTPYVAIDVVEGADDDPFFQPDPANAVAIDVVEGLAGVRFETTTWSALKVEAQYQTRPGAQDDEFVGVASWSFGL